MGGHTQFGEFTTREEAEAAWQDTIRKCIDAWGLFFLAGNITFNQKDEKYRLAMRFTK